MNGTGKHRSREERSKVPLIEACTTNRGLHSLDPDRSSTYGSIDAQMESVRSVHACELP